MDENKMKVDFGLLVALTNECQRTIGDVSCYGVQDVMEVLAMCEIPMSDAVMRLGVIAGVFVE